MTTSATSFPAARAIGAGHIAIAIIEDNRLVREGMTEMLNMQHGFEVVLALTSVETGRLRRAVPHVVLLDVGLEDQHCLRLAEQIRKEMPDTHVIVMDLLPAHEEVVQFVNAGVAGFILKDASMDDFVATVRSVAAGTRVLPSRMTATLFSQIALAAVQRDEAAALEAVRMTQREREVIALIAEGMSNKEIALRLNVASETVKSHVRNVMEKLALHSRLQIAAYAHQQDSLSS